MKLIELFNSAKALMVKYGLPNETLFVNASLKQFSHISEPPLRLDYSISFFYTPNLCDSVESPSAELLLSAFENKLKTRDFVQYNSELVDVEIDEIPF